MAEAPPFFFFSDHNSIIPDSGLWPCPSCPKTQTNSRRPAVEVDDTWIGGPQSGAAREERDLSPARYCVSRTPLGFEVSAPFAFSDTRSSPISCSSSLWKGHPSESSVVLEVVRRSDLKQHSPWIVTAHAGFDTHPGIVHYGAVGYPMALRSFFLLVTSTTPPSALA